jgi:hypothetical protein
MNIEDVKVGDFVYSYDTITGTTELKEVTAVFVRESDHINYLTIVDGNGNVQVLETTDGHPFWVVTDEPDLSRAARSVVDENGVLLYHESLEVGLNGFWVEAQDLREGDVFIGANGELSTFVSKERIELDESITVYNFTVEGNHDYFVIAQTDEHGQTCVLVHNAEYGPDQPGEKIFKLRTLEELLAEQYTRHLERYSSNPNNVIPELLKIAKIRPTPTPPIYPGQPGYNYFPGVPNPPGVKVWEKEFPRGWGKGQLFVDPKVDPKLPIPSGGFKWTR